MHAPDFLDFAQYDERCLTVTAVGDRFRAKSWSQSLFDVMLNTTVITLNDRAHSVICVRGEHHLNECARTPEPERTSADSVLYSLRAAGIDRYGQLWLNADEPSKIVASVITIKMLLITSSLNASSAPFLVRNTC